MDDALRRGELYRKAGADVLLLSMAHTPEKPAGGPAGARGSMDSWPRPHTARKPPSTTSSVPVM